MHGISRLIEKINAEYDMWVGTGQMEIHASLLTCLVNTLYGKLATLMTRYTIVDLISVFHDARTRLFWRLPALCKTSSTTR